MREEALLRERASFIKEEPPLNQPTHHITPGCLDFPLAIKKRVRLAIWRLAVYNATLERGPAEERRTRMEVVGRFPA